MNKAKKYYQMVFSNQARQTFLLCFWPYGRFILGNCATEIANDIVPFVLDSIKTQ